MSLSEKLKETGWSKTDGSEDLASLEILKNQDGVELFVINTVASQIDDPIVRAAIVSLKKMLAIHSAQESPFRSEFKNGKWMGPELGSKDNPILNLHMKGEVKGLRLEQVTHTADSMAKNSGRIVFKKSDKSMYLDTGVKFKKVSSEKFEKDIQVSNPSEVIVIDLTESDISDAARCIWQVCDNGNDFIRVNAKIKTPSPKQLVIELPMGCAEGTYRILGVE